MINDEDTHIEITEVKEKKGWKIKEWTGLAESINPIPMTREEIDEAIKYLRERHYPRPLDCPGEDCPGFRPACKLRICYVAVRLCGDF